MPDHGSGRTAAAPQWVWQNHGPCPGTGCGEILGLLAPVGVRLVTFNRIRDALCPVQGSLTWP